LVPFFHLSLVVDTLYFLSHGFDVFLCALAASLDTNELRVNELESKLTASNRALEEAQAEIFNLKAKKQQELKPQSNLLKRPWSKPKSKLLRPMIC
jgi:hypothetical protein